MEKVNSSIPMDMTYTKLRKIENLNEGVLELVSDLESDMLDRLVSIFLFYQEKKFHKVKRMSSLNFFLHKFTKNGVNIDNKKAA
jgi:hypothetical protein